MSVYIYMQVYICIHMYIYMLVCKNPLFSCNLCSFQVACLLSTLRRVSIFATSLDELISRADQLEPAIISWIPPVQYTCVYCLCVLYSYVLCVLYSHVYIYISRHATRTHKVCKHANPHAYKYTTLHARTRARTRTHTHPHTRTCTHTHTHTYRFGFLHYNTVDEVDRVIEALSLVSNGSLQLPSS